MITTLIALKAYSKAQALEAQTNGVNAVRQQQFQNYLVINYATKILIWPFIMFSIINDHSPHPSRRRHAWQVPTGLILITFPFGLFSSYFALGIALAIYLIFVELQAIDSQLTTESDEEVKS